jgi:4-amino-4-deoxy-L-arabinose transferase-like glycosyltransferase
MSSATAQLADRTLRPAWWWGVAWAVSVATALACRPLLPIDETRYLSVAWEMWRSGDFLVPHLNGQIYAQKPPLLFWLFHLGWALFGVNEWWPRLVPGLLALGGLVLTARLSREIWPSDERTAVLSPALLAATALWAFATTAVMFDMLIVAASLVAWIGGWRAWRGRRGGWMLVALGIGLGGLAKGPVILLVALPPLVAAPWWGAAAPDRRGGWYGRLAVAVLAGVALTLAWAVPAAIAGGTEYRNTIFIEQTQGRLVSSFAHRRPFWWYLALLPALAFPLAVWPPLWRGLRAVQRAPRDAGVRFCLAATLPALVVFSLISGKQPHYLLALMPPFALLAARGLGRTAATGSRRDALAPTVVLALVGAALAALGWVKRPGLPAWAANHPPAIGLALLVAAVALFVWCRDGAAARPERLIAWTLALFLAVHLELAGAPGRAYDIAPFARRLADIERTGGAMAFAGEYQGQFHFLGRLARPVESVEPAQAVDWLARHPGGCLVATFRVSPPPGLGEPDLRQDYRGQVLGAWLAR